MTTFPEHIIYQPLASGQRFPPIPTPPESVNVVSFDAFVASGINVPVDEIGDMIEPDESYEEFDALGVATIALPAHKLDHHSLVSRKKRRTAIRDPSVRSTWWEVWDETESVRKKNYNQRLPPAERLSMAAEDFREDRPWPPADQGIANYWDQFRMYIGLLAHPKNPNQKDGTENPDVDDASEPVSDTQPLKARKLDINVSVGVKKRAKLRQPFDPDDPKTERFLDDPETSVKIFLSSHFSRKGLLWSRQRCQAFPILVRFFCQYLIRCKAFSEKDIDSSLRRAVEIAKCAEAELPKTGDIARTLPNDSSRAFGTLWGPRRSYSREPQEQDAVIAQDIAAQELIHEETRKAVEMELAEIAERIAARKEEEARQKMKEALEKEKEARIALERASELQEQLASSTPDAEGNGEGAETDVEVMDGSGDEGPQSGGESGAWPSPDAERGTWGGDDSDSNEDDEVDPWAIALPALISTLGPTAIPLTHRTGVVECSTRRIKEVLRPATRRPCKKASDPSAEAVEEDLATRFARVVLEPWPTKHLSSSSQIEPPRILPSSHGKVDLEDAPSPGIEGHALHRDDITILLDPTAVALLENAIGMGLGATWTQIKRDEGAAGKKGKGKVPSYWYMEGLVHQIPSFWTDDMNGPEEGDEGDDEYLN